MKNSEKPDQEAGTLVVVWTSGDIYVAERMVFMYTHAVVSKNFFDKAVLIIWGPSAKLVAENLKVQQKLRAMQNDGVLIQACITCANEYGVADELKDMGFEVKAMGETLSGYLKDGAKVLTF